MPPAKHVMRDPGQVREMLRVRRRDLAEDLRRRLERVRAQGTDLTPATDIGDGEPTDLDLKLLEIQTATLRHLDMAIESLDDGRYGRCRRCQGPINEARLRAMPFAVRCQRCESDTERDAMSRRSILRKRLWGDDDPPRMEES